MAFTSEVILDLEFSLWERSLTTNSIVKIYGYSVYVFLRELQEFVSLKEFVHFIQVIKFIGIKLFLIFPNYILTLVMFPFSFPMLIIRTFFLIFLISLARCLLLIFSRKTSLCFHWFFSFAFLFSISLITACTFITFFLLITLEL